MALPSIPPLSSGPTQVRAYIADILKTKHEASSELAEQIAGKWQFGRSIDLRESSLHYFRELFGADMGTFLFRSVQEDVMNEWKTSTAGIFSFRMFLIVHSCVVYSLITSLGLNILSVAIPLFYMWQASNRGSSEEEMSTFPAKLLLPVLYAINQCLDSNGMLFSVLVCSCSALDFKTATACNSSAFYGVWSVLVQSFLVFRSLRFDLESG